MATEQQQARRAGDDDLLGPSSQPREPQTRDPPSQGPWSWRLDIASFACSIVVLGAIIAVLAYFQNTARFYFEQGLHPHRIALGCLLLALYIFLLIPASNCLYRLRHARTSYPTWLATFDGNDAKLSRPLKAVKAFFTVRLFGVAPFLTFAIVVAAASAIVPWTQAIFTLRIALTPAEPQHFGQPWVNIATDLNPDRPGIFKPPTSDASLLNAIHQAVAGYGGIGEAWWFCEYWATGSTECSWDNYATLQVRAECRETSEDLKMSSTHSIFEAMRDVASIPPYDPVDDSQGNTSSPAIMSLKETTFLTLSNLLWYAEPRRLAHDSNDWSKKGHRISKEAWERLREFSIMTINPVDARNIKDPAFNQTAGTLANFQVIYAELGITGYFTDGKLSWIDVDRGESTAFECSLDLVVQPKTAQFRRWGLRQFQENNKWNSPVVMPSTNLSSTWSCEKESEACYGPDRETIDFLWDERKFSIDRRITSRIWRTLKTTLVGSGFADKWHSKGSGDDPTVQATSDSMTLIFYKIFESVTSRRGFIPWNVASTFITLGQSLNWWIRNFYGQYCHNSPADPDACGFALAFGKMTRDTGRYVVHWKYVSYPIALVVITALVMIAAAFDQRFSRIRLGDDDDDRSAGEGEEPSDSTSRGAGIRSG